MGIINSPQHVEFCFPSHFPLLWLTYTFLHDFMESVYMILTSLLLFPFKAPRHSLHILFFKIQCPGNHQQSSTCLFLISFVCSFTLVYINFLHDFMKSSYMISTSLFLFLFKAHRHALRNLFSKSQCPGNHQQSSTC